MVLQNYWHWRCIIWLLPSHWMCNLKHDISTKIWTLLRILSFTKNFCHFTNIAKIRYYSSGLLDKLKQFMQIMINFMSAILLWVLYNCSARYIFTKIFLWYIISGLWFDVWHVYIVSWMWRVVLLLFWSIWLLA